MRMLCQLQTHQLRDQLFHQCNELYPLIQTRLLQAPIQHGMRKRAQQLTMRPMKMKMKAKMRQIPTLSITAAKLRRDGKMNNCRLRLMNADCPSAHCCEYGCLALPCVDVSPFDRVKAGLAM